MSPDLFVVAETPALLGGMAFPDPRTDLHALHRLGFSVLIRLHPGDYDPAPLTAYDFPLEDLYGGREPRASEDEERRVREAARLAAESVAVGRGVLVHCLGGTGRTGTVLACALRDLGRSADEAIRAVQAHRPRWPESSWQEEVVRREPAVP